MIEKGRNFLALHKFSIALALILLLAFGLRIWGIGFGLPNLYHPDEDAVVMPAINIIKTGNLEPTRMEYGSLHIYLLTAVSALTFVRMARNGGYLESPADLPIYERGTYPAVYPYAEYFLASRLVSVLLGVGIVLLLYMLVTRLTNKRQGLLAALLAAILPALVTHSHFATTDTALTFWSLLGLYLIIRVFDNWEDDSLWSYVGAGFVCGLAASTKYNGIVLIVPLVLVPLLKAKSLDELLNIRTFSGLFSMGLGFLAGTPYAIVNLPKLLYWVSYSLRLYNSPGQNLVGTSWQWHLNYHLNSSNTMVLVFGVVGFFFSWRYWGWCRALIINSFTLIFWLAIVSQTHREVRMWLPTAPIFIAWAVLLIDLLSGFLREIEWPTWTKRAVSFVGIGMILLFLGNRSIAISSGFASEDVRSQTQQWIEANIPTETAIAVEYFSPNLDITLWPVTKVFSLHQNPPEWYQEQGVEYFVFSEAGNDPSKMPEGDWARRQEFIANYCLVESFSGPFLSAEIMSMWVYRSGDCE